MNHVGRWARWALGPPTTAGNGLVGAAHAGRRAVRGAAVGAVAVALVVTGVGVTPAHSQGLGTNGRSPDAASAQPGQFTQRSGLVPDRDDAAAGAAALRAALERDLGVSGAALDELLADSAAATALDARLRDRLGDDLAGTWFDHASGSLMVAVTDPTTAALARAAGARTRLVARSGPELTAVTDELAARHEAGSPLLAGVHSWGIDPATNQVVVTVQEGTGGAAAERLAGFGEAVRVEEAPAAPQTIQELPFLDGGLAYNSPAGGCSTGFNLRDGAGVGYILTAGHCSNGAGGAGLQTNHAGIPIGPFVQSFFNIFDDAIIRNTNDINAGGFWNQGPWVWTYPGFVTINSWTAAPVGAPICKSGRTTGLTCGFITGVVDIPPIRGLIQHSACAEPGDSGGPNLNVSGGIFAEGVSSMAALSGGLCLSKFGLQNLSYYYPIADSLPYYSSVFGVNLLTG